MSDILREYVETILEQLYIRDRSILKKLFRPNFDTWYDKSGLGSDREVDDEIKNFVKKNYEYALKKSNNDPKKAKDFLRKMIKDRKFHTEGALSEITSDFSMSGLRRMQAPGNIRNGSFTRGSRSSLANDLNDMTVPQDASVVLVRNGDKVLAVSRGEDLLNLNMPGGGIEQGETPVEAAARELKEETGIESKNLTLLFVMNVGGKKVHVFKADNFTGDLRSSNEGIACWESPTSLLKGQYANTFKKAMKYCV